MHPIIHLGFGLEFNQPVIVAEALAEAAVHENWQKPFFLGAEKAAKETKSSKTLPQLLDEVYADKKLSTAAEYVRLPLLPPSPSVPDDTNQCKRHPADTPARTTPTKSATASSSARPRK